MSGTVFGQCQFSGVYEIAAFLIAFVLDIPNKRRKPFLKLVQRK